VTDLVTYLVTLAAEIGAAFPGKIYDPAAWLGLLGGLLLGGIIGPGRGWTTALGWGLLAASVLTLESVYLGSVPRGDSASLAIICVVGWTTGQLIGSLLRRREQ
jgi:hypothetical protein